MTNASDLIHGPADQSKAMTERPAVNRVAGLTNTTREERGRQAVLSESARRQAQPFTSLPASPAIPPLALVDVPATANADRVLARLLLHLTGAAAKEIVEAARAEAAAMAEQIRAEVREAVPDGVEVKKLAHARKRLKELEASAADLAAERKRIDAQVKAAAMGGDVEAIEELQKLIDKNELRRRAIRTATETVQAQAAEHLAEVNAAEKRREEAIKQRLVGLFRNGEQALAEAAPAVARAVARREAFAEIAGRANTAFGSL